MRKINLIIVLLLLTGCQLGHVKKENQDIITAEDSVVLCNSLLDKPLKLDRAKVLRELKKRKIDSCLVVIADHECPSSMALRQKCLDESAARTLSKTGRLTSNQRGTEILMWGVRVGMGILPF